MLRRLWLWLLEVFGLLEPPSPLVRLELDMSNARLSWTLPTPSGRQRPLSHVRIKSRVSDALPWSEIATVAVPETTLLIENIDPGDWQFRGILVDDSGAESVPVEASLLVPFEGPAPLENFEASLE